MHPSDIIGSIAAIAMVFGYLPQTVRTVRTRSTDGILTGNIPLFVTNLLTTIMSSIVFGIKIYNDYFKKRR